MWFCIAITIYYCICFCYFYSKMKYIYYIVFTCENEKGVATGCCDMILDKKIKDFSYIEEISKKIESSNNYNKVLVTNYILLTKKLI